MARTLKILILETTLYIDEKPNIIDGDLKDNINFYRKKKDKKLI